MLVICVTVKGCRLRKQILFMLKILHLCFVLVKSDLEWIQLLLQVESHYLEEISVEITKQLHGEGARTTLTTNGRLLSSRMEIGKYLDRVNVSIHSMEEEKYEQLVGVKGSFNQAKKSIKDFRKVYPNLPIAINTTCIRGVNSDLEDFTNLIGFAKQIDASIKVIELFPNDMPNVVELGEIGAILRGLGFSTESEDLRRLKLSDGQINIVLTRIFCSEAVRSGNPASFCNTNNDLFISPDGFAKPCRADLMEVDFNPAILGRNEQDMANVIDQAFSLIGSKCIY